MTLLFCIILGLAAVLLWIANSALIRKNREQEEYVKDLREDLTVTRTEAANATRWRNSASHALFAKAEVEERIGLYPCFAVYREDDYYKLKHDVRRYYYSTDDRDDRDYKRICAEELADMLNEKL